MLLNGGTLNGTRIISPRMVQYVTRNRSGSDRQGDKTLPVTGMGVDARAPTGLIRGRRASASPGTFGHGRARGSYSWADPETGVSFMRHEYARE